MSESIIDYSGLKDNLKTAAPFIKKNYDLSKITEEIYILDLYDKKKYKQLKNKKKILCTIENIYYKRRLIDRFWRYNSKTNKITVFDQWIKIIPDFILKIPYRTPYRHWLKKIKKDKKFIAIIPNKVKEDRILNFPYFLSSHYSKFKQIDLIRKEKKYLNDKNKFCAFIVSNPNSFERIYFFNKLNKYKKVDSLGAYLNNVGTYLPGGKEIEILRDYKFCIYFENSFFDDYITEKIFNALEMNTIPIYRGAPNLREYINTDCIINFDDNKKSYDKMIDKIIELDNDDKMYEAFFNSELFDTIEKKNRIQNIDKTLKLFYDKIL